MSSENETSPAPVDAVVIVTPSDLPFPLSLVVQLIHHCVWNNPQTQDMKCNEIKAAIGVLFDDKLIDDAMAILRGESR